MRIHYKSSGGVAYMPRLQAPTAIEVDELDSASRNKLTRLIQAANFFELPEEIGSVPQGSADVQSETLTIEQEGLRHSVKIVAPAGDGSLYDLLREVRACVKMSRSRARNAKKG